MHCLNELKEHLRLHRPHIVALLETHINRDRVDEVCQRSGYDKWHQIETQETEVKIVQSHVQFITTKKWKVKALVVYYMQVHTSRIRSVSGKKFSSLVQQYDIHSCLMETLMTPSTWRNETMEVLKCLGNAFRGLSLRGCGEIAWQLKMHEWIRRYAIVSGERISKKNYLDPLPLLIRTRGFSSISNTSKSFPCQVAWTSHACFDQVIQKNWKADLPIMPALYSLSETSVDGTKKCLEIFLEGSRKFGLESKASNSHCEWGQ
ncbi:LOW QUALITY PROTEIN: hypothetical protein Cgig2_023847 [Carnegiea gigantea]|uniref:Uncharacterized protein n=1 Tax=Carnegiea gigantea TaxID=171969 RepID=A0A9Q1K9H4_9CARY|nr:LOW QUALITY PROTEIN: hypothetical protein Cgig2_023847 [Carnegiea gigantea]